MDMHCHGGSKMAFWMECPGKPPEQGILEIMPGGRMSLRLLSPLLDSHLEQPTVGLRGWIWNWVRPGSNSGFAAC